MMTSIAHVGCGYWGRNLVRNFAELGALTAVVDSNSAAAEAAAKEHKVRAMSFEDVLASPDIEGVSIASPAVLHASAAKAALEAGKHVYVEKPLALDLTDAEELLALARKHDRVLMVGHLLQYHPAYRKLVELVRSGALGRLRYAYSNRLSLGKFRTEENVLWSFAPHDISMLLGLFGSEPTHVTAEGHVSFTPGVADAVNVQMHFPGGESAHIQVSWMHPFKEQRLVVIGETAMAVFEDSNQDWGQKLVVYEHKIAPQNGVPVPVKADPKAIAVDKGEPLKLECQHFIDCIAGRTMPITGGEEGLRVLRVLDAAERSLQENLAHQARRSVGAA